MIRPKIIAAASLALVPLASTALTSAVPAYASVSRPVAAALPVATNMPVATNRPVATNSPVAQARHSARPGSVNLITALVVDGSSAVTPLREAGPAAPAIPVGAGPIGAAFTRNGKAAYVIGGDSVTPITITDGVSATALPAIPLGRGARDPVAIAITPNGKTALVVTNFSPYWVTWINLATKKVIGRTRAGTSPIEVAITPNGKYAYVTDAGAGTVTPFNIGTRKALKAIRVGFAPEAIAITPNGRYAYVANNLSATVSPIRLSDNKALKPVKVGKFPAALAITPNGRNVYVTNNGSGSVTKIRVSDRKVVGTIKTASFPDNIVITPNGKNAYVASFDDQAINTHLRTVTAINLLSGKVIAHITVGHGPIALGYSGLARAVYVADFYAGAVTPIAVSSHKASPAISLAPELQPDFIAIDPKP